jgi:hypothetical protein
MRVFVLLFFIFYTATPKFCLGAHSSGGEITWICLPNGQFKFFVVFYRDCNGIPGLSSINLTTTVPGLPSITMPLVQQIDMSPGGFLSNGFTSCPDCNNPSGSNGIMQKLVYESIPVTLNGVPPPTGWLFYWGDCCLNGGITNVLNPGSTGLRLRTVMYPYNGQNTNPCFDSSPYFTEPPAFLTCTGSENSFSFFSRDADRDSLAYNWSHPLSEFGAFVTYNTGYSSSSPTPGPVQDPANVPAAIDGSTGLVTHFGVIGGKFLVEGKVTAYKCGVKVSETFRSFVLAIENNCPPVLAGSSNSAPEMQPPFVNPYSGLQVDFADTVIAGQTVHFSSYFTDFDLFTNGSTQNIHIEAYSDQFGTNFTDSLNGCAYPPCAFLNQSLPVTVPVGTILDFTWHTTCDHVYAQSLPCTALGRSYYFVFRANDNYCPGNGSVTKVVSIFVKSAPRLLPPVIRCTAVNQDGSVDITWSPSASIDSMGNFRAYRIYATNTFNGPYLLVDSITSGIGATSYHHSASSINALFGGTANEKIIFYKIETVTFCSAFYLPPQFSNVMSTMRMNVSEGQSHQALLNWLQPSSPPLSSHSGFYRIYAKYPGSPWTLIDSTTTGSYTDFNATSICNDSISYQVEMLDSTGCVLSSSIAGQVFSNPASVGFISPPIATVCPGMSVMLTATTIGSVYLWNTGATTQAITVNTTGTYTVTVTQPSGCSGSNSATVNNFPPPAPNIVGNLVICQGQSTSLNAGGGYVAYLWNTGASSQVINVQSAGTYTVTVTNSCGTTGSGSATVTVNPLPNATVTAMGPTTFCEGDSVQLMPSPPGMTSYTWYRFFSPVQPQPMTQWLYAKTRGAYYCVMTDANGCSGTSNTIQVEVPCISVGPSHQKDGADKLPGRIIVYPNPTIDRFILESEAGIKPDDLLITDLTGRAFPFELQQTENRLWTISGLPPGIFLLFDRKGPGSPTRLVKVR